MQIQFKGHTYDVAVGNGTVPVPGDTVSSGGLRPSGDGVHRHVFSRGSLTSVPPDPKHHGPELVPTLRHLLHRHRHQWWLRGPVLCVLKVHQTEIKSRLVTHAQPPACWWATRTDLSAAFPSARGRLPRAGVNADARLRAATVLHGTGWPLDGSRIKTVERDFWSLARAWDHWDRENCTGDA